MRQIMTAIALATLVMSIFSGCGGSSSSSSDDPQDNLTASDSPSYSYVTLDASAGEKVYLNLSTRQTVTVDDSWHVAYERFIGFSLNGGVSGSGTVSGCIAKHYAALYDDSDEPVSSEFQALSADNTQADFEAIDASACSDFISDEIKTHIDDENWLEASFGASGPSFSPSSDPQKNGWIIRSAAQNADDLHEYGKVRVAEVNYQSGETTTRQIKLASSLWNHDTQTFSTETTSDWLDFSDETAYWDMETNTVATANNDWELSITVVGQSWDMQVNSGVSGPGLAGVGLVTVESGAAADVTDPTNTQQVFRFFSDTASGALKTPGDFGPLEYDVFGTHDMTPNFAHYLITDGTQTFKFQVLSNYGETDDQSSGNLYIRYQEL